MILQFPKRPAISNVQYVTLADLDQALASRCQETMNTFKLVLPADLASAVSARHACDQNKLPNE